MCLARGKKRELCVTSAKTQVVLGIFSHKVSGDRWETVRGRVVAHSRGKGPSEKTRAIGVVRGELLVGNGGVQNHRAWAVPVGGNLLCSLKGRGGRWEGSQRRGTLSLHAR